jgi:adenylosuccinate lyase
MIGRYTRDEMGKIWTDEARLAKWLEVEILACEAWAAHKAIPKKALKTIKSKASFDVKRVLEIEAEVKHDVIAFLTAVAERVGPDSRYIHMGMTSSDLLDTAFACQLLDASKIIVKGLKDLLRSLKKVAKKHKLTPQIGRSHGIHAEPITFGLKTANFYAEFSRHLERFSAAIEGVRVGKLSGAVGTFAHIPPSVERYVCWRLHLKPAPVSSQIVQRDRHAHYFATLAGIASSIEKLAVEIRHLQRTEVGEAAEPFGKGQKGSSAMPHKRNPILCENLTGLARIVRANAMAAFENVATWHERDISHSSVERVIGPDSTILVDFMLSRIAGVIARLDVYPQRMQENLDLTHGLFNSQEVMLALIKKGMKREDAYRTVQVCAMEAWKKGKDFQALLGRDGEVRKYLDEEELVRCFDLDRHFAHVDDIFRRVFKK